MVPYLPKEIVNLFCKVRHYRPCMIKIYRLHGGIIVLGCAWNKRYLIVIWKFSSCAGFVTLFCVLKLKLIIVISYEDRKSTRLNSSHVSISYAVFCLKKKIIS